MERSILLLFVIFGLTAGWAQAPYQFNFQAVARNLAGNPMTNTAVDFRLSIVQGDPEGTVVYIESQTTQTNNFGLANLLVGSGVADLGSLATLDWMAGPYFLRIELADNDGNYLLVGSSPLMSVPYALHAITSEQAGPQGPPGEQGPQGEQGAAGANGLSAYEVWLSLGNSGTVADYLNSLKGETGAQGAAGAPGQNGVGIFTTITNVNGSFTLVFTDGSSYTTPSLVGPQGEQGPQGEAGPQGSPGEQGPQGSPGLVWRGSYNESIQPYSVNDVVEFNGSTYVALVSGESGYTPDFETYWALLAAKGNTGEQGPQGSQGETGPAGPQGAPGLPGLGILSMQIVNDSLIITYSDGALENAGKLISDSFLASFASEFSSGAVDSVLYFSVPGTYSWTVPEGISSVMVEAWGGGGGAQSSGTCGVYCGYGNSTRGQGGGYASSVLSVTPGEQIPVVVGAGGQNRVQFGVTCCNIIEPGAGGNSSFGSEVVALGGAIGGQEIFGGSGQLVIQGEPGYSVNGPCQGICVVQLGGDSPRGGFAGFAPGGGGRYFPSNEGTTNHGGAHGMVKIWLLK